MNVVQKLFRSWETVHPYNAAQALKLRTTSSDQDVARAWQQALTNLNFVSETAEQTKLLTPDVSLQDHFSSELNQAFADDTDALPFRPFLLHDSENFWIGLTYRHFVADSVSIRMLLREWLACLRQGSEVSGRPLSHARDGYWSLFAAGNGRVKLDQTLSTFIRGHYRLRSARKPITSGQDDLPVRVMLDRTPEGLVPDLRHACQLRGMRLSDVLLAALLETSRRNVPLQSRQNRRDVAVGCIVNLRPYAGRNLSDSFGLFLGFTSIVGSPKDFSSPDQLLRSVRKQTCMHRQRGIAPTCTMWVNAGLALGYFMPRRRLYHFYRKSMPLAAGLSSVNVAPDDLPGGDILEYVRVSPTGPIAPAVLSTTEIDGRLSLALTYRPAVITANTAGSMLHDFVGALRIS